MSRSLKFRLVQLGALMLMFALLFSATGCKKKTPPPPPPPAVAPPAPAPPARPEVTSFTAEPRSIEKGQSSTLKWSVSNATDLTIDQGIGAVQSEGTRAVQPDSTTTYTLSVKGPGGTESRSVTVEVATPPPPPPPAPAPSRSGADIINQDVKDVYFDYNKNDIRADAQTTLQTDADVLKKVFADDPNIAVLVEGNCDERGSAEYNVALGDRRASAAKDYLVQLGVPADRLKTVSYGKEKPVCTDASEDCYQRNRHDHFSPTQK